MIEWLSYYAYVFSSTKLEIRAEQALPGSEGGGCGGGRQGGEMTQTMYAYVNKWIIRIIRIKENMAYNVTHNGVFCSNKEKCNYAFCRAIVNSAVINRVVQVPLLYVDLHSFGYICPRVV
jgi:hypothetical protein